MPRVKKTSSKTIINTSSKKKSSKKTKPRPKEGYIYVLVNINYVWKGENVNIIGVYTTYKAAEKVAKNKHVEEHYGTTLDSDDQIRGFEIREVPLNESVKDLLEWSDSMSSSSEEKPKKKKVITKKDEYSSSSDYGRESD